jgi:alanine dehydrogenase
LINISNKHNESRGSKLNKNNEHHVGLTPAGVFELVKNNHTVIVESKARQGSGFLDEDYLGTGAVLLQKA